MSLLKTSFFLALALVLTASCLFGQADANKGQITGTVFDPKQAVVPNAKVTIRNTATGATRELTTGVEGQFRAVLLDPGAYDLTINAPGFAPAQLKGVVVSVGSAVNLPVPLQLGATGPTVEVTDTPPRGEPPA